MIKRGEHDGIIYYNEISVSLKVSDKRVCVQKVLYNGWCADDGGQTT